MALPPSPTPRHVANAYGALIAERAAQLSGKDQRLSANEASKDPLVADAYARHGKKSPGASGLASAARAAMLQAAAQVTGGDGRISRADASKLPAALAAGFDVLRGAAPAKNGAAIAANLGKLAEGLWFVSEGDDPYQAMHVKLDPSVPVTAQTLKEALVWDAEEGDGFDEYDPYPVSFELDLRTADDFWAAEPEALSPSEASKHQALEKAMKSAFAATTAVDLEGNAATAKIWTVTVREEDSVRAPYYVFGRMPSGDLVGLKTWRTWT